MNSILNLVKVISYKNYVKFLKIENCHGGESDHMIYTALLGGYSKLSNQLVNSTLIFSTCTEAHLGTINFFFEIC